MECRLDRCPRYYEEREVAHTVRRHSQLIVIDRVPAEVCSVCGDVLFTPETIRRMEQLLGTGTVPVSMVPLYEFA